MPPIGHVLTDPFVLRLEVTIVSDNYCGMCPVIYCLARLPLLSIVYMLKLFGFCIHL
jgi:hypothetical protein